MHQGLSPGQSKQRQVYDIPAISRTQQQSLPCQPTITDKGLDLSSLLSSCFRTEIYSSLPPMSPLLISGIPPSIAMKPVQPGAQQLLPQTADAKESSLGIGGSSVRSCLEEPHYHINPAIAPVPWEQPTTCTLWKEQDSAVTDLCHFHTQIILDSMT